VGIATCPSDLIVILCRGSHSAATQLRVIPSCEPSFLRSASVTWVDFLGANSCAPITSHSLWGCIYLSLVSCTWFSPGHGPLMGRICPRVSQKLCGYFTSQVYPLLVLELMALKPPFSSPCYCSELSRPDVFLGRCPSWAMSLCLVMSSLGRCLYLGDVLAWAMSSLGRCLCLGDVFLGDVFSWAMSLLRRCPCFRATSYFGDVTSGRPVDFSSLGPLRGPTMC